MAASLLAPLLPEGIKEEEERWRRKVICKEVEPVSEVKETSTTEEAATIVKPQEIVLDNIEDPSQEDLCSVVQSGESEEEEEQDTLELELVLERKKVSIQSCKYIFFPQYCHTLGSLSSICTAQLGFCFSYPFI